MAMSPTKTYEQRTCAACQQPFTPRNGEQGRKQRCCSVACAGVAKRGKPGHKPKRKPFQEPTISPPDTTDRSALIAKVAAEMGVPVSPDAGKPREAMTRGQFAAHWEKVHAAKKASDALPAPRWAK